MPTDMFQVNVLKLNSQEPEEEKAFIRSFIDQLNNCTTGGEVSLSKSAGTHFRGTDTAEVPQNIQTQS